MKTLIILAIAILGCVNAMGQQTVDLDKASQRLKKSDLPFKSCKVMAYTNQGVEYRGKACATYRDLSRKRKSQEETGEMYVPFWFEVGNGCKLFSAVLNVSPCLTEMLVTYKGNREADRLETKLYFNNDIAVKQWQLTAENALRSALDLLSSLADGKRMIGVISHVPELRERIDKKIVVHKKLTGSQIELEY